MEIQKKHIGKKFGKILILDQFPGRKCLGKCDCGNEKIFRTSNILVGQTTSCGCLQSINRKDYDEHTKEKILNSIEISSNGCWNWKKSKNKQGYGQIAYKNKPQLAHRISWKIFKGELNPDILVCHKCDNPSCVNPDHLFLGTDRDNIMDSFKKGRIKRKFHNNYKLDASKVKEMILLHISGTNMKEISKKFDICREHANAVIKRKVWKNID